MDFDKDFCVEEERCGFTVSAEMKKNWWVQMDLLQRFQQVCAEHGLRYFACGGTLLGAIRHKGYIPWDDDIDIAMLREDYEKLLTIAPQAFAEPYFFQTAYNDVQYSRGHAQLRNSTTTAILNHEKGKFSFNQGIFIDIFPMDSLPDDETALHKQQKKIKLYNRLLSLTVRYPTNPNKNIVKSILHGVLSILPYRAYYRWMEKTCQAYNGQHTQQVGYLSFDPENTKLFFPRRCFDKVQEVPFEHMTIAIPAAYDELLTLQYGDYMTMRQENSYHGGVLFDTERSYMDYLK